MKGVSYTSGSPAFDLAAISTTTGIYESLNIMLLQSTTAAMQQPQTKVT